MREKNAWSLLKGILEGVEKCHYSRIENGVEKGMPDVEICCEGIQVWVELKHDREDKVGGKVLTELRSDQRIWLNNRALAGGRAFILLTTVHHGIYLFRAPRLPPPLRQDPAMLAALSVLCGDRPLFKTMLPSKLFSR